MSLDILEENNSFLSLVKDLSDEPEDIDIDKIFPEISVSVRELLKRDKEIRDEIILWLNKEAEGSQFNAIRHCCIPSESSSESSKSYSNDFCESYKVCPFYRQGIAPEGDLCPIESLQVKQLTLDLVHDLNINIYEDLTDKMLVGELIQFTIIENRAIRGLACFNLGFTNVSHGKMGKEFTRQKNYYLDIIKDMQLIKERLRKSLVSTRSEKIRLKQDQNIEKVKNAYEATMEKINKSKNKKLDLVIDVTSQENE